MTDLLAIAATVTAIAASLAAVAGFAYSNAQSARAKQASLAAVHSELTTGETAAARNVMGTFRYTQHGASASPGSGDGVTDAEVRQAYFVILWAIERADNALSHYSARDQHRASGFIRWNLDELTRNVVWFRSMHAERLGVSDEDAWTSFTGHLRSELVPASVRAANAASEA
jgi:hypothetical protein